MENRQICSVWAGSRGCLRVVSDPPSANELRQKLRNTSGGGYDAKNSQNTLPLNTLKCRWTLSPACRAWPMTAAGSQHLLRSRPCSFIKYRASWSVSCALVGILPSVWAGLSLLNSFSENVRKRNSCQWVSFWIKPLVLGSHCPKRLTLYGDIINMD